MKTGEYYAITSNEDGHHIQKIHNIEGFLKECIDDEVTFASDFPLNKWSGKTDEISNNTYLEENECLLIYGSIVVPKKQEVVTEYRIDNDR